MEKKLAVTWKQAQRPDFAQSPGKTGGECNLGSEGTGGIEILSCGTLYALTIRLMRVLTDDE